jgi:hypothetical protein
MSSNVDLSTSLALGVIALKDALNKGLAGDSRIVIVISQVDGLSTNATGFDHFFAQFRKLNIYLFIIRSNVEFDHLAMNSILDCITRAKAQEIPNDSQDPVENFVREATLGGLNKLK